MKPLILLFLTCIVCEDDLFKSLGLDNFKFEGEEKKKPTIVP